MKFIITIMMLLLNSYFIYCNGVDISLVTPKETMRFQYSGEQGFDTSCGLSTAATLLSVYWSIPVTEAELIQEVFSIEEVTQAQDPTDTYTVNFNDISSVLSIYGVVSRPYRMNLPEIRDALSQGFAPLLVHYEAPTEHFALVLAVLGRRIITADPARGVQLLRTQQFEQRYSGAVLVTASREHQRNTQTINEAVNCAVSRNVLLEQVEIDMVFDW
ncbi:MAG: cysteine peptidase family C39 domain-containing protein [Spirochaetia bacterium]